MTDPGLPRTPDCKVVMLGKASCGKTSLANRYINGTFTNQVATVGMAFLAKDVDVKGRQFQLGIWDTAGSERFQSITPMYYRGATVALLCYSVEDGDSLDRIDFWYEQLSKTEPDCSVFVVGTMIDKMKDNPGEVDMLRSRVERWAQGKKISSDHLFMTSSLTGDGVQELFTSVAEYCAENLGKNPGRNDSDLKKKDGSSGGKCCVIM